MFDRTDFTYIGCDLEVIVNLVGATLPRFEESKIGAAVRDIKISRIVPIKVCISVIYQYMF